MRVVHWIEPVTPVTAVMVHRHRQAGMAMNWAATTYCGHGWSPAGRRNGDNMNGDNYGQNGDNESLYLHGLKMWLKTLDFFKRFSPHLHFFSNFQWYKLFAKKKKFIPGRWMAINEHQCLHLRCAEATAENMVWRHTAEHETGSLIFTFLMAAAF